MNQAFNIHLRPIAAVLLASLLAVASGTDACMSQDAVLPPIAVPVPAMAAEADAPNKRKTPAFLKPIVNEELSFIKRACEPTPEQMKQITAAAKKAFDEMSEIVQLGNQNFVVAGQVMIMGPNNARMKENPYTRVRKDAEKYLAKCVTDQQHDAYRSESKARSTYERRAAIGIVVGMIDDKVVLDDEQYDRTIDALLREWKTIELLQLQNYLYNPQYVPVIPDAPLRKVLSKTQYKVWKSYPSTTMWVHLGNDQGLGLGEQWIK